MGARDEFKQLQTYLANPFHDATRLFPYPLLVSENLWVSHIFGRDEWHEMG